MKTALFVGLFLWKPNGCFQILLAILLKYSHFDLAPQCFFSSEDLDAFEERLMSSVDDVVQLCQRNVNKLLEKQREV